MHVYIYMWFITCIQTDMLCLLYYMYMHRLLKLFKAVFYLVYC